MNKKRCVHQAVKDITANYRQEALFCPKNGKKMPDRSVIIQFLRELKQIMFPGYFGNDTMLDVELEHYVGYRINKLYDTLMDQITIAMEFDCHDDDCAEKRQQEAIRICDLFFKELPVVQRKLLTDVQAAFDGDPAAKSKEEIIFSYPGLFAIYVYRVAHILYQENVQFIPRIMSEYAHSRSGIDINPGAKIGEYFFIDHGTGVVIGETTEIGDYVKIYQGVTLGALSTRDGQQLSGIKRHPTIKDHVTVYANTTILGGKTVIGENTIVGGNTFIVESIPANTKIYSKSPELVIKGPKPSTEEGYE